jgi:TatD DNase family protein
LILDLCSVIKQRLFSIYLNRFIIKNILQDFLMKIFDSHCHLNDTSYTKEMDQVISRAEAADVKSMMIVGITGKTSFQAVNIASAYPGCYASVGIHPHDAKECSEDLLTQLIALAENPHVKAWGETGLDFNRMFSPKEVQEKWFVRQLEIADELNLPLIFHERDSKGRFLEILKAHYRTSGKKGVIHCFSGNQRDLDEYLKLGFYIGITGILTIKTRGEQLREMAPIIPINRMVIETDAPYLTPAPEKNHTRRNEPAFVRSVLMKLAQVKNEPLEKMADTLWNNTCRLFNINEE